MGQMLYDISAKKLSKADEAFKAEFGFYTDSKLQRKSVSNLLTHSGEPTVYRVSEKSTYR